MRHLSSSIRHFVAALLRLSLAAPLLAAAPAWAQSQPQPQSQSRHNVVGTPLDTIKNSHLTADVPEAKDFVKATRPDVKSLHYTPLSGAAPERPKPLNPAGIKALQAELESAGAKNEQRAKGLIPAKRTAKAKPAKTAE